MAYLAPNVDLEDLWTERSEKPEIKMRDSAYKVYENAYLSRTGQNGEQQNVTWRPIMLDGNQQQDTTGRDPINLAKQIGLHHIASSARPPRIWNEAASLENQETALKNTALIQRALRQSQIKLLQTQQAAYLAVRGDAVYGVAYDTDKKAKRSVWVKVIRPDFCYPGIDDNEAPGHLQDMLISYEVRKSWAQHHFSISLPEGKSTVRVFEYWDDEWRILQVDAHKLGEPWKLQHKLGFVPWYWCYNQIPGLFAQADIAETPKIQGMMAELLILGLDAMKKQIDKSYYAIGHKGTVTPQAGKVIGFPNPNTKIDEFPTAVPPQMVMQFMEFMKGHAEAMAGISPISSEGMAEGSIVTGSAVRHQVEAIEARAESKRTSLETAYGWLGESILKVYAKKLGDREFTLRIGQQEMSHGGGSVGEWTQCEASYGSFEGLPTMERGQWAMQGLGRIHGRRTAIQLAYPERDTEGMEAEVDDYQLQQARLSAEAQAQAQQVLQSAGGPAPGGSPGGPGGGTAVPGAGPARPQPAPPQSNPLPAPGLPQLGRMVTISDLKTLVALVRGQIKGDVYATGEMAIVGMAVVPSVAVTRKEDQALVQSALQSRNVDVSVGVTPDEPKVQLNAG